MIVISKEAVMKLKFSSYQLNIFLKNGKWMRLNIGINNMQMIKDYFKKTNWI
jgi:methylase of polypeptide subunit release factors